MRAELVLEPRRQVALGQLWSRNNVNTQGRLEPVALGWTLPREREPVIRTGFGEGVEEDRLGGGEPRRGDGARGLLLQRKGKQEDSLAAAAEESCAAVLAPVGVGVGGWDATQGCMCLKGVVQHGGVAESSAVRGRRA